MAQKQIGFYMYKSPRQTTGVGIPGKHQETQLVKADWGRGVKALSTVCNSGDLGTKYTSKEWHD